MPPVLVAAKVLEALKGTTDRKQLLKLVADEVRAAGEPYSSVYLYMLHGGELILEAYSGRATEHKSIKVGHGVCGTAVAQGKDQIVPDVRARDNYIACNIFTRSELVVLIYKGADILGQIDIDSDFVDPFSAEEVASLRTVAKALGELL